MKPMFMYVVALLVPIIAVVFGIAFVVFGYRDDGVLLMIIGSISLCYVIYFAKKDYGVSLWD
jgi:hypothetical protein